MVEYGRALTFRPLMLHRRNQGSFPGISSCGTYADGADEGDAVGEGRVVLEESVLRSKCVSSSHRDLSSAHSSIQPVGSAFTADLTPQVLHSCLDSSLVRARATWLMLHHESEPRVSAVRVLSERGVLATPSL